MFDLLIVSSKERCGVRRLKYFAATAAIWMVLVSAIMMAGIYTHDARLNSGYEDIVLVTPLPLSPPRSEAAPRTKLDESRQGAGFVAAERAPTTISDPSNTRPVAPPVGEGCCSDAIDLSNATGGGGAGYTSAGGIPDGVDHPDIEEPPALPPVTEKRDPEPRPAQAPVVRRSEVLQGTAIKRVTAAYPPLARAAHVSGPVVVEVTIDEAGNCVSARALSGHPLLKSAAVAAARGWKWAPTRLNGAPVKVVGTITFYFNL